MNVVGGYGRPLALLAAASCLLLAAFLEALFMSAHTAEVILATLFGIPAAWLVVRFAVRMKGVTIDVFSPTVGFLIAYVLWFGLGSLTFLLDVNPPPYLFIVFGFLAYTAGTSIAARRPAVVQEMHRVPKRIPWVTSRFRFVMLIFFLLMAGSYLLLIAQIGIPALHDDVAIRREALGEHHYLVNVLLSTALTVTSFAAADLWSETRVLTPVVSVALIILATLMQGSFGNRGFVATPLLMLLVLWHYWKKPIPAKRLAVIFAVMFAAFIVYDYSRASAIKTGVDNSTATEAVTSSSAFTLHTSLSNLRDIVEAIPSEIPYQHGNLTFGALLQILPGHHESSDEFFKRILGNDFQGGGQPGTLLAPLYGDFGRAGIIVGMFLFGVSSAKVHTWMKEKPTLFRVFLYTWFAQNALFSLYGALLTYFITLWIPFTWWILDRWMSTTAQAVEPAANAFRMARGPASWV
jgi:oligosaccharide repeat unit polymerase